MMTDTTPSRLDAVLAAAAAAAQPLAALRPRERAVTAVADALDAAVGELVPLAGEESGLPQDRLRGELLRTTTQLRLFSDGTGLRTRTAAGPRNMRSR